jgi:hypothetical protein
MIPRFQFSLRTLLIGVAVLSIPCAYVGWQYKIVRERKAWRAANPDYLFSGSDLWPRVGWRNPAADPSLIRRWLGDEAVETIWAPTRSVGEAAEKHFPEAEIISQD